MSDRAPTTVVIADNVRAELARARRSQTQAAAAIGLSQPSMSRRLMGEVDFTVPELMSLAAWLEVELARLLPPDVAA